jgi:hypothetical protein
VASSRGSMSMAVTVSRLTFVTVVTLGIVDHTRVSLDEKSIIPY